MNGSKIFLGLSIVAALILMSTSDTQASTTAPYVPAGPAPVPPTPSQIMPTATQAIAKLKQIVATGDKDLLKSEILDHSEMIGYFPFNQVLPPYNADSDECPKQQFDKPCYTYHSNLFIYYGIFVLRYDENTSSSYPGDRLFVFKPNWPTPIAIRRYREIGPHWQTASSEGSIAAYPNMPPIDPTTYIA